MERKTIRVSDSLNNKDLKVVTIEENYGLYTVSTQYRGFVRNGLLEQTVQPRTRVICNTTRMYFDTTPDKIDDYIASILKIREYIAKSPKKIMVGRGCSIKVTSDDYSCICHRSMVWISLDYCVYSYGHPEGKGVAIWQHGDDIHIEEGNSFDSAFVNWKKHITSIEYYSYNTKMKKVIFTPQRIIEGSEVGRNLTVKQTNNGVHRILGDWLCCNA